MAQAKGMMFLYAQTWLHPGAGTTTGAIDLPVQREVHTDYPVIPASSVKGSLRDKAERRLDQERAKVDALFGPDIVGRGSDRGSEAATYAGALVVGDGKMLLFPVRSLNSSFYWVTSPLAMSRLKRDLRMVGIDASWEAPTAVEEGVALVAGAGVEGTIYLEEMDFQTRQDDDAAAFARFLADHLSEEALGAAFHEKLQRDVAVIGDEEFAYFVKFATQVSARIQLTSRKTTDAVEDESGNVVEKGNLWYEETIPPETLFYVACLAEPARGGAVKADLASGGLVLDVLVKEVLTDGLIQLGANETLGHGWCAAMFARGNGG